MAWVDFGQDYLDYMITDLLEFPDSTVVCIANVYGYNDESMAVMATGISPEGEVLWETPLIHSVLNMNPNFVTACTVGDDIAVVWNFRFNPDHYCIAGQILHSDGTVAWTESDSGRVLLDNYLGEFLSIIPSQREDALFWLSYGLGHDHYLQGFSTEGEPVFDDAVALGTTYGDYWMKLMAAPTGDFWAAWAGHDPATELASVRYRHFDAEGTPFNEFYENTDGLLLSSNTQPYVHDPCYVLDCEGGLVATWLNQSVGNYGYDDVYTQRAFDNLTGVTDFGESAIPLAYSLDPVYPNPFNPSTRVRFTVPSSQHVTLTVFDILGRQVTELVNRPLAAGKHQVTWNGSSLASGMYFVQLKAGEFSATQKAILMK